MRERERERERTREKYRFHPDGRRDTYSFLSFLVSYESSYETVDNPLLLIKERYIPQDLPKSPFSRKRSRPNHHHSATQLSAGRSEKVSKKAGAAKERERDRGKPRKLGKERGEEGERKEGTKTREFPRFSFFYRDVPPRFARGGCAAATI